VLQALLLALAVVAGATGSMAAATAAAQTSPAASGIYAYDLSTASTTAPATVLVASVGGYDETIQLSGPSVVAELGASAAEDGVPLYRAVSPAESDDAIGSQQFSQGPNSMEGKWFAENGSDADEWGQKMFGSEPYRIIKTTVPQSYSDSMFSNPNLDGIGPARYADNLGELNRVHGGISEYVP